MPDRPVKMLLEKMARNYPDLKKALWRAGFISAEKEKKIQFLQKSDDYAKKERCQRKGVFQL